MAEEIRVGPFRGEEDTLAPAIAALLAQAMRHPWNPAQTRDALVGEPTRCVLARDSEGSGEALLGVVLGRAIADGLLEIDQVAVDPERRRRGLGRTLVARFLDAFGVPGADGAPATCHLELAATNAPALALYTGLGFVVVGRRPRYYPDGDDALLLSWSASPPTVATGEAAGARIDSTDPTDPGSQA